MSEEIREQAQVVAVSRVELASDKESLAQMREVFNAEHEDLILLIKMEETKVSLAEATLRELALLVYAIDPTNKKPGPGVAIRDRSVYGYSPEDAFEWAKSHRMCLKLDDGAYKDLVKAGQAPGTVTTEPVATIATDLAKALLDSPIEGEAVPQ